MLLTCGLPSSNIITYALAVCPAVVVPEHPVADLHAGCYRNLWVASINNITYFVALYPLPLCYLDTRNKLAC